MAWLLVAFCSAFFVSVALTKYARDSAGKLGLVDLPDGGRKGHTGPIPRAGGLAIFATLALLLSIAWIIRPEAIEWSSASLRAFLLGAIGIFVVGVIDDFYTLNARTKLGAQVIVALAVFALGLRVDSLGLPTGSTFELPLWVSCAATVLWIVALTNAFNFIDGSDGVAGGAALCAALSLAGAFLFLGDGAGALFALLLAGSVLGFLFFNFPPATIFLGDSGSLLLGYALSGLGILTAHKTPTLIAIAIPVVACGLPIIDICLTVVRRYFRRNPLFEADRGHIHHRLTDLGNSPRKVALSMYGVCATFALLSLLLAQPAAKPLAVIFGMIAAVVVVLLYRLRIPELLEFQRVLERSLQQRAVVAINLRIREGAERMAMARDGNDVVAALRFAFESSDVEAAEVRLTNGVGHALYGCADVEVLSGECVWRLARGNTARNTVRVHVPICRENGDALGYLELHRKVDAPAMLSDLGLITGELQPQLRNCLLRLAGEPIGNVQTIRPISGWSHSLLAAARRSKPLLGTEG
jgi:UDP-GlcNAc:undecaprenyl-phosphate/decaprenyl-phosphate GlcNAc-1-phosphate transferase